MHGRQTLLAGASDWLCVEWIRSGLQANTMRSSFIIITIIWSMNCALARTLSGEFKRLGRSLDGRPILQQATAAAAAAVARSSIEIEVAPHARGSNLNPNFNCSQTSSATNSCKSSDRPLSPPEQRDSNSILIPRFFERLAEARQFFGLRPSRLKSPGS